MKTQSLYIIIGIGIFMTSCNKKETQENEANVVTVKTETVAMQTINEPVSFTGRVFAKQSVKLSTKLLGTIEWFNFEEGDKIKAGELLVKINDQELQAKKRSVSSALKEAEANLDKIEKDYGRISTLYERKSATTKELDEITYALEASKAKVEGLKASLVEVEQLLSYAYLKAPFNGYITKKFLQKGDLASPGAPILMVESLNEMKVVFKIPEQELSTIETGKQVKIKVGALQELFSASISAVNPSSLAGDFQFEATAIFDVPDNPQVKPGMFAEVFISKPNGKKVMINKNHLIKRGQLTGVFTINNQNKAAMRWLRTGKEINGQVEILSGLTEGERYIVTTDQRIVGGENVKALNN